MNFDEVLEFIHNIPRFNKELGLAKIQRLLGLLGNPQDKLKFVHIAGTNGKGSTCAMMSHILAGAGYKTGMYISPFVLEFRERIQLNNEMIPHDDLTRIGNHVIEVWKEMTKEGEPPSEFEVVLAIAMCYFAEQKCDVVVLEVGMGGRLDATNVITAPLVSVIMSISIDHVLNLGTTVAEIAGEKAGIIKQGGTTVCYPKQDVEALEVIMRRCSETDNRLIIPHNADILEMNLFGSRIVYDNYEYNIPLLGEHQVYNAITAIETCNVLMGKGFALTKEQVASGIKRTTFPSRMEILSKEPLVILDGAHNLGGAQTLANALKMLNGRKVHCVMGMVKDKDVTSVIDVIVPHVDSIVTTWDESNPRFFSPHDLAEIIRKDCANVEYKNKPIEALESAASKMQGDDVLLICGSLYLASVLRTPAIDMFKGRQ